MLIEEKAISLHSHYSGVWRSWLAHLHGVQVVVRSSRITPTRKSCGGSLQLFLSYAYAEIFVLFPIIDKLMTFPRLRHLIFIFPLSLLLVVACGKDNRKTEGDSDQETIAMLDALIRKDEKNADLYYRRAKAYMNENQINEALKDIQSAISYNGKQAEYYILQADLHFISDASALAFQDLQKALDIDPKSTEAYLKIAELALFLRDYDKTMENVDLALKTDKFSSTAYFIRGWALKEKGDTVNAVVDFKRAVELNANYEQANEELGILYALKNDPIAVEYLKTTLTINSKNTQARYALGYYYQTNGMFQEALDQYQKILHILPSHADALNNTGYINMRYKGDYETALQCFDKAILADSSFYQAYCNRGEAYEYLGEKQKAIADFKTALALNPRYKEAEKRLKNLGARF